MPELPIPIGEQFLHPPIGVLAPFLDWRGPYAGNLTITHRHDGPPIGNTFGVMWQFNGIIPIGWGFENGWVSDDGQYEQSTYETRLFQLVVQHQFRSGVWTTTQLIEPMYAPGAAMWEVALPGRLGLLVAPGIRIDLYYLGIPFP
jgi:hypothetical protein